MLPPLFVWWAVKRATFPDTKFLSMIPWVEVWYTLSMCCEYKKIDRTHYKILLQIHSGMFCFVFWTSLWWIITKEYKLKSAVWEWEEFWIHHTSSLHHELPSKPVKCLFIVVVFIARAPSFLTWWSTSLSSLTKPTSTQLGLMLWAGASDCSVFSWFRCGSSIKSLRWKGQCYRLVCRYACGDEMTHLIMVKCLSIFHLWKALSQEIHKRVFLSNTVTI